MKLSKLVNFKNELDKLSSVPAQTSANQELNKVIHLVESFELTQPNIGQFHTNQHSVNSAFETFEKSLNELKLKITQQIEQEERAYFQESYRLYDKEMIHESNEYILNRRMSISEESRQYINARLARYADWKYAGLVFRPGHEDFVKNMVMYDPLYLIDQDHELLQPAVSQFTEEYQRRLRTYVINERANSPILSQIPDHQFGVCFAYNYFNFKPFEVLKQYFQEIYNKLKPGGTFMLTINDCDRDKGVMLLEQNFCCYTPGRLVKQLAETVGYHVEFEWHDNGPWTWLELKKPGTLTSLRGGQTLAKIMLK